MILVTGATGKTGSRVLAQLMDRGCDVRAQIRDGLRVDQIPAGAAVVVSDFNEPEEWDAAVSECQGIYLSSPAGPDQWRQEAAVVDAAVRAGGGAHIVKLAALGLDDPHAGRIAVQHARIRDDLADSGLPWTVLAPSQFMDNVLLYQQPVSEYGILPVPAGDAMITWVAPDDVAAVAVTALTTCGHSGRTYEVTGSEALHHNDVAGLLATVLGRDVTYVDTPPDEALAAMVAAGVPEWVAAGVVEMNGWYAGGGASVPTDAVATIGGRAPTTLADFLTARLAATPGYLPDRPRHEA